MKGQSNIKNYICHENNLYFFIYSIFTDFYIKLYI